MYNPPLHRDFPPYVFSGKGNAPPGSCHLPGRVCAGSLEPGLRLVVADIVKQQDVTPVVDYYSAGQEQEESSHRLPSVRGLVT